MVMEPPPAPKVQLHPKVRVHQEPREQLLRGALVAVFLILVILGTFFGFKSSNQSAASSRTANLVLEQQRVLACRGIYSVNLSDKQAAISDAFLSALQIVTDPNSDPEAVKKVLLTVPELRRQRDEASDDYRAAILASVADPTKFVEDCPIPKPEVK